LGLWPAARRAWRELARLEPVLVVVGAPGDVPAELLDDPAVRIFEPVPSLHAAFQAQCIRLLYPALLEAEGVVISDIDMVPLADRPARSPQDAGRPRQVCTRRLDPRRLLHAPRAPRPRLCREVAGRIRRRARRDR